MPWLIYNRYIVYWWGGGSGAELICIWHLNGKKMALDFIFFKIKKKKTLKCSLTFHRAGQLASLASNQQACKTNFLGVFNLLSILTNSAPLQNIGASASVLLMHIQGWFPLGLMGWISLQSRALSGIFPRTTVWKHCALSSVLSWMLVANCWGVLPSNWQLVFISLGAKIPSGLQLFYFSSSKCVSWFFYLPPLSLVITCVTGANKNIFFFLNSLNISSIS